MGAGVQRWWRDYVQESAAWTGSPPATDYRLVEARSESGIVCKVRLHCYYPMYYGTFKIT